MNTELGNEIRLALMQGCRTLAVMLALYFASVGPVYRLCLRQGLSKQYLALYRPIASLKSPVFPATFQYVLLWM